MTTKQHHKPRTSNQIFLVLQERIQNGVYAAGERLPTERTFAQEFAVDRYAIQRSLEQLHRQGLIIKELGRRPVVASNPSFRNSHVSISEPSLKTIAALLPHDAAYPAAVAVLTGVNAALRRLSAPYRVIPFDVRLFEMEEDALREVEEQGYGGVIIWHSGEKATLNTICRQMRQGIPFVFVDRYPHGMTCDFVGVDNRTASTEAVNYLLKLGHTRIGFLTSTEETTAVMERHDGYLQALEQAGITPQPEWIAAVPSKDPTLVTPAVEQLLKIEEPLTAVYALNDSKAHYFIAEVERRGLRVPDDISVIGFDDLERYSPRPALLTTMHQPFHSVGERAAHLLLNRMQDAQKQTTYQHILLTSTLVVRSTTSRLMDVSHASNSSEVHVAV